MIVRHFVRGAGGRPYIWAWMVPVLLPALGLYHLLFVKLSRRW